MTHHSDISLNGSCWDDGPTLVVRGECDPMPPKCELHAGHLGAHRSGKSEWMRNPTSYRQVSQERDEALADLARAKDCIEKIREWEQGSHDGFIMWRPLRMIFDAYDRGHGE